MDFDPNLPPLPPGKYDVVFVNLNIIVTVRKRAEAQLKVEYAVRIKGRPVEFIWPNNYSVYLVMKASEE